MDEPRKRRPLRRSDWTLLALAAVIARTGPDAVLHQLAAAPPDRRRLVIPGLAAVDPALAARLQQEPEPPAMEPAGRELARRRACVP